MHGSLNLTVSSPPQGFEEPLTLAEVYEYLNLPVLDLPSTERDVRLNEMITAAREVGEAEYGRDVIVKQWDKSLDDFCEREIELNDPLISVELVQYRDCVGNYTTLVEDVDYVVDTNKHPGIILPAYNVCWPSFTPWPSSAVLIRFTSGHPPTGLFWTADAGKRFKMGMLYLISAWFNGRLPFESGSKDGINEYPWSVTQCFRLGALSRVG